MIMENIQNEPEGRGLYENPFTQGTLVNVFFNKDAIIGTVVCSEDKEDGGRYYDVHLAIPDGNGHVGYTISGIPWWIISPVSKDESIKKAIKMAKAMTLDIGCALGIKDSELIEKTKILDDCLCTIGYHFSEISSE